MKRRSNRGQGWLVPLGVFLLLPLVAQFGCGLIENEIESRIGDVDVTSPLLSPSSGQLLVGGGVQVVPGHNAYHLGDTDLNERYVTALAFGSSVPNEPSESQFKHAVLRIFITGFQGAPTPLGPVLVDYVDSSGLGNLDPSFLAAPVILGGVNTGILDLTTPLHYDIIVTAAVAADRAAGRPLSLFLLSLATDSDGDGSADYTMLGGASTGTPPVLILTFEANVNI